MANERNNPTVLIVDDENEARSTIRGFLELRYNCVFAEASDGQEAIDFLKDNPCDLILLDIRMPKKGGMDVIKEAKIINPRIDILIVSAWVSDDVAEEALELGATDYVIKPIDFKALLLKFENIFEKRGQKVSKT